MLIRMEEVVTPENVDNVSGIMDILEKIN